LTAAACIWKSPLQAANSGGQYRYGGKGKLLSFGAYPYISLKEARDRREEAKTLLAHGTDPGEVKRAQKLAVKAACTNSFEAVAREWFNSWKTTKAESHSSKVIGRLEKDVFPWIGKQPVAEITPPEVLVVLREVEKRGMHETAQRVKNGTYILDSAFY
jgi:hypothetical protein